MVTTWERHRDGLRTTGRDGLGTPGPERRLAPAPEDGDQIVGRHPGRPGQRRPRPGGRRNRTPVGDARPSDSVGMKYNGFLPAATVGGDPLIGDPYVLGRLAGLIKDVDGNAAARVPIAADAQPNG